MTWWSLPSWLMHASTPGRPCFPRSTGRSSSYLPAAPASSSGQGKSLSHTSAVFGEVSCATQFGCDFGQLLSYGHSESAYDCAHGFAVWCSLVESCSSYWLPWHSYTCIHYSCRSHCLRMTLQCKTMNSINSYPVAPAASQSMSAVMTGISNMVQPACNLFTLTSAEPIKHWSCKDAMLVNACVLLALLASS